MMRRKERFLRTVESLCDHWPPERATMMMGTALRYEEEMIPENAHLAALEFVCGVIPARILHRDGAVGRMN